MIKLTRKKWAIAGVAVVAVIAATAYYTLKPRYAVNQDWYTKAEPRPINGPKGFRMFAMVSNSRAYDEDVCNMTIIYFDNTAGLVNSLYGTLTVEHPEYNRQIEPYSFNIVMPYGLAYFDFKHKGRCEKPERITIASMRCTVENKTVEGCDAISTVLEKQNDGATLHIGF